MDELKRYGGILTGSPVTVAAVLIALVMTLNTWADTPNKVLRELWTNETTQLSSMDWTRMPDSTAFLDEFKAPTDEPTYYIQRLRAYITVPTTDSYTFWTAADDQASLLLSVDGNPANATEIASLTKYSRNEEYTKYASQQSAVFSLTAGQTLYLEVRHRQGAGGHHCTVAWSTASDPTKTTIPGTVCTAPALPTENLLMETWNNILGKNVADLTSIENYPNFPDKIANVCSGFQSATTGHDYGSRVRGYLTPTVSGNHVFWVSADDSAILYLSTDNTAANKAEICRIDSWCDPLELDKFPSQQSTAINLTAGQGYYIELLHKEAVASDHYAVTWQPPGGVQEVIPASVLTALTDTADPGVPTIATTHVSDRVVRLTLSATDDVGVKAVDIYRDGVLIDRATSKAYSDDTVVGSTTYSYTAKAIDHSDKVSAESTALQVTTPAAPVVIDDGTGLAAAYFDEKDFTGTRITRTDSSINFDWGTTHPDPSFNDGFSVRWMGTVVPRYTEIYTFTTTTDDGCRLWVNGQSLVDDWNNHAATERSGTITLEAGQHYELIMEYYDHTAAASAKLEWESLSQPKQVVPQTQLFPSAYLTGELVTITTPNASAVSPAFVEGRVGADANTVSVTVDGGATFDAVRLDPTNYYADGASAAGSSIGIGLNPDNPVQVSISTGSSTQNQTISWTPTVIGATSAVTIRQFDSLLLTVNGAGTITIDTNLDSSTGFNPVLTGPSGSNFPTQFSSPGTFTVAAQLDGIDVGSTIVTVVAVNLQSPIACQFGYERVKSIVIEGGTDQDVEFGVGSLTVSQSTATSTGADILIVPYKTQSSILTARLGPGGPMIATGVIDAFRLTTTAQTYMGFVEMFPDGSVLLDATLSLAPQVPDLDIQLVTTKPGVTFEDSTTVMWIPSDNLTITDGIGTMVYRMITPDDETNPCHYLRAYQDGVQVSE